MAVSLSPTDLSVLIHEADVRARALVRALRRPAHEIEDIRQDLLTDLISRLPAFDPARGSLGAFAGRLARNRATEIANAVCRERRLWGACPLSLDQHAASDEAGLMARMPTDQGLGALLPQSTDWPTTSDRTLDLEQGLAWLSPEERALSAALLTSTIDGLSARGFGSRAVVFRRLRSVRLNLMARGLSPA